VRRFLGLALVASLLGACTDAAPTGTAPRAPQTLHLSKAGISLAPRFCSATGGSNLVQAPPRASASLAGVGLSSASLAPTDANEGEAGSEIYGINEAGWVVGAVYRGGMPLPAVKEPGQPWRVLSSDPGFAYDINNHNQAVGFVAVATGPRAVRWSAGGSPTVLGDLAIARAINDRGQVVGTTYDTPVPQAFLYSGGTLTPLGTYGGLPTSGYGINENGDVVGAVDEGSPSGSAFVKPFGAGYQPIPNSGGYGGGIAYSINDAGEVVGQVSDGGGSPRAFYVKHGNVGSYRLIPTLGGQTNTAFAINNAGVVVGSSRDATGSELGFRWDARTQEAPVRLEKLAGGCGSITLTINDCGTIGGVTTYAATLAHATLWGGCAPKDPELEIVKSAGAESVPAGSPISFTLRVTNSGEGPATGVTLTDPLPVGAGLSWNVSPSVAGCSISGTPRTLTCNFAELAPSDTILVTVVSATTKSSCGEYDNQATVSAENHGAVTSNEASVEVVCSSHKKPKLRLEKSASDERVEAGKRIGFTLRVTNEGDGAARDVTLMDVLPKGPGLSWSVSPSVKGCSISGSPQTLTCRFAELAPSASIAVTVVSETSRSTCGKYVNTGKVFASNHGKVYSNEVKVEVKCTSNLKPNLRVVKTADDDRVEVGTPIGFTIKVTNAGPGTAEKVQLLDVLQPGFGIRWQLAEPVAGCSVSNGTIQTLSCSFGDLPAGASRTVKVVSPTETASKGTYVNVVKVWADNHTYVLDGDKILVEGYSKPCVNGCKSSYWKSKTGSWKGYQTGQKFNQVFGVNLVASNATLHDALKNDRDGKDALAREAVAALLNAAHPQVSYGPTPNQVIKIVQAAVRYRKYDLATSILRRYNERNCPLK